MVGVRCGLGSGLAREAKDGGMVVAGVVSFERGAPYGHTSRYAMSYTVADTIGAVNPGSGLFKTWEELKEAAHSMAVDDAMRNGHHLVLVQGGDF